MMNNKKHPIPIKALSALLCVRYSVYIGKATSGEAAILYNSIFIFVLPIFYYYILMNQRFYILPYIQFD